ncbi:MULTISPECIES: hypothetical protein [Bacillus cereus group]|uniref:hypothetical protein n=1 Tax=Bacillus cereus group TaxID=86661 RepID=UPI001F5B538D|nr:hypothetical protein [Bacillus cereus group sp. N8]
MELTKLEKAIAIGTILSAIKGKEFKEYVDLEKLPPVIKEIEAVSDKTTRKVKKEADISLINKLINSFLAENNQEQKNQSPPIKNKQKAHWGTERGASCNTQVISRDPPTQKRKKRGVIDGD